MGTRIMRRIFWIAIALLVVASAQAAPPDAPPANKAGNVTALLPLANFVRGPAKQEVVTVAKKGDDVIWNDLVRTDKGGRARITLLDQSILSVGSQAELRIIKHDTKSQQTSIEVGYGRVRMEVTPVTKQGGSFEVKTSTAVAGVIGTVFGIDSSIGATTFLCLSGTVSVGSSDPNVPGRVSCTAGMAAVVTTGKAPVTRPATQQEMQQLVQDTEPAVISAINPSSLLPGATTDVTITGTQLANVSAVSSSSGAVTAALNPGGTASSVGVHLAVAATATPGPVTLTLTKTSGVGSAAVFSVLAPPSTAAAGGDYKQPYLTTIDQERQSALAGLNGLGVGLSQSADQAYNQISAANGALSAPLDISQAAADLKTPVNAEMNVATTDGTNVNQAAQTAASSFTTLYNAALQTLLTRNSGGTPDNQFQNDLTSAFNQVNATLLGAFGAAQTDLGQQVQTQNAAIQQITTTWLTKIQQLAQTQAPPSIKALSASAAPSTGGVPIIITGANFDPSTKVMFGNVPASNVTFISSTQLSVVVPAENPGTVDINLVSGSGLTTTMAGAFSFGGPVPLVSPADKTVNPGETVILDASRSSDTLAGATLTYNWTFCSLGFRPPQLGTPLPLMSASTCTTAPGTVVGTDSQFALTPPITPGQYYARLQVNDNLGAGAVIYSSVTVSQPSYDDPATRMVSMAQAYSSLMPDQVLAFFDATGFPAYTALGDALRDTLPTYSSLRVNLQGLIVNANAGLATIQANWQLIYTIKDDPACRNVSPCQPPTYTTTVGSVTTVWTLTPGKGWWITDLRPQPTLPGLPVTTTSLPDLQVTAVVRTGPQTFQATVLNAGTAPSTASTVHFVLTNPTTSTQIGTADGALGAVQVNGTGLATATIDLSSLTQRLTAQITATVNPGCTLQETNCNNNTSTFNVDLVPLNVPLPDLKITGVTVAGQTTPPFVIGTGTQTLQATVTNSGPGALTTPTGVHFALTDTAGDNLTADGTLPSLAAGASAPVSASMLIPSNVRQGTSATLSVTVNSGCAVQESDCTNNSVSNLTATLGSPPSITVTSSRGNTSNANPIELNGILAEAMTLTATRPDTSQGSVTLAFTDQPQIANSPTQLTSIPYNTPEAVDFSATIDAGGNVTTGPTSALITPTNANPTAAPSSATLYFSVGDILLTLPSGTVCIPIGAGGQAPVPAFSISAISGFNVPTVSWQWSGLGAGVSINQVSGTSSLSGTTYSLPAFSFTVTNPVTQTALFAVTITNSQGLATKAFSLSFNFATACGQGAGLFGVGHGIGGTWSRGAFGGGGMAKSTAKPVSAGSLPDLQISASSVTFSPSIPKSGDTVSVRFRVTNAGAADAQRIPIALVINGSAVASDTFDVRAGASTLAALEWSNAHPPSSQGAMNAAVVVDANHTIQQQSALAKTAPLAHFAFLLGTAQQTAAGATPAQRATLEVADGGCAGFRFASGAGSGCGSADVEITAEQLSSGHFSLSAQNGIADIGAAMGGRRDLSGVQYQSEVAAVAGHTYAVQLRGGKTGILRLMAIRNPAQTAAKGRQVFNGGSTAKNVGVQSSAPVETGDVSGVRTGNQLKAYFDVSYQTE